MDNTNTSNNLEEWDSNPEEETAPIPSVLSLPTEEKDLGGLGWEVAVAPTTSTSHQEWDSDTEEPTLGWEVVRFTTPVSPEEWDCDSILEHLN